MKLSSVLFALTALFFSSTAASRVEIRFVESAPKDSFIIVNGGKCDLRDFVLDLDLAASRGQLVFDTTEAGAGVEVFQPFESLEGGLTLVSAKTVADGDKTLSVRGALLPSNQSVSFTIDVDDTLADSSLGQIRVTGAEIQNAVARLSANNNPGVSASFDANNRAVIASTLCAK